MRAVMSLSGGMDSTGLLIRLISEGYKVSCISFDYGQKHKVEIEKAAQNITYLRENNISVEHKVIDLTFEGGAVDNSLGLNSVISHVNLFKPS